MLAALKRGECDGLLPAACGFLDAFVGFLEEHDLLAHFEQFPDARRRRSIGPEFFCNILLHKALFRLDSLAEIGTVLFQSPDVLRRLGFNLRQVHEGFYHGSAQRPFNPEALADFFNGLHEAQLCAHQAQLAAALWRQFPVLADSGTAVLDANTTTLPAGHHGRAATQIKTCVLGLRGAGRLFPLLWDFTTRGVGEDGDVTQGKRLVAAAQATLGPGALRRLLVDRGFIDGAWLSELKADGLDTIIGLRENMSLYEDMLGLCGLPDAPWLPVDPPQLPHGPLPQRELCPLTDLNTWSACTVPLQGVVIRDTYPDRVQYQCLVTTDLTLTPRQLHRYARDRWSIEESFMDLTRYWGLDRLGSCRPAVGRAQIHFLLLAYTLLHLYDHETQAERAQGEGLRPALVPGREITAYFGNHYAILLPSELFTIVFDHNDAWLANREQLLAAMRLCEGDPTARAPD